MKEAGSRGYKKPNIWQLNALQTILKDSLRNNALNFTQIFVKK